jgi:hypothetical protein
MKLTLIFESSGLTRSVDAKRRWPDAFKGDAKRRWPDAFKGLEAI